MWPTVKAATGFAARHEFDGITTVKNHVARAGASRAGDVRAAGAPQQPIDLHPYDGRACVAQASVLSKPATRHQVGGDLVPLIMGCCLLTRVQGADAD